MTSSCLPLVPHSHHEQRRSVTGTLPGPTQEATRSRTGQRIVARAQRVHNAKINMHALACELPRCCFAASPQVPMLFGA